jgi:hypothetical protein
MPAVSALWFGIKWNGPNAAAVGTYPPKRLSKARVVTRRADGFGKSRTVKKVGIAWPVPPQSVVRVLPIGKGVPEPRGSTY